MAFMRVIIPTRNGVPRITRMLNSIKRQTFTDYHLVIVDDCSDSPEVPGYFEELEDHSDEYGLSLTVCMLQERRGPGGAKNMGMHWWHDDAYTYFLDDDDHLMDEFVFQRMHDVAVANDMPDILRLNYRKTQTWSGQSWDLGDKVNKQDTVEKVCMSVLKCQPWSKCVRTEKMIKFPEGFITEDAIHHIKLCDGCETVAVVPEACVEWLLRKGSISTHEKDAELIASRLREASELLSLDLSHSWAKVAAGNRLDWVQRQLAPHMAGEGLRRYIL